MAIKGYSIFPMLQDWKPTIRLFCVMSRTLVGWRFYPRWKDAVSIFYQLDWVWSENHDLQKSIQRCCQHIHNAAQLKENLYILGSCWKVASQYPIGAEVENHTRERSATCTSMHMVSCEHMQLESSQGQPHQTITISDTVKNSLFLYLLFVNQKFLFSTPIFILVNRISTNRIATCLSSAMTTALHKVYSFSKKPFNQSSEVERCLCQ